MARSGPSPIPTMIGAAPDDTLPVPGSHELRPNELSTGRRRNHTPLSRESTHQGKPSATFRSGVGFPSVRQVISTIANRADEFTTAAHERELNTGLSLPGQGHRSTMTNRIGDQFGNDDRNIIGQSLHPPFQEQGLRNLAGRGHRTWPGLKGPRDGVVPVTAHGCSPAPRPVCQDPEPPGACRLGHRLRALHALQLLTDALCPGHRSGRGARAVARAECTCIPFLFRNRKPSPHHAQANGDNRTKALRPSR